MVIAAREITLATTHHPPPTIQSTAMKYLPTITLTSPLLRALSDGQLKLQKGQWIKLWDDNGKPSRFVQVKPSGTIHAVHPNGAAGAGKVSNERFQTACRFW